MDNNDDGAFISHADCAISTDIEVGNLVIRKTSHIDNTLRVSHGDKA